MVVKQPCTGMYTKTTMGQFLTAAMSTISTLIQRIMNRRTLRRSPPLSIVGFTLLQEKPLYDIEVELDHAYTLSESGVVTSNSNGSDAFREFALVTDTKMLEKQIDNTPEPLLKAPEYCLEDLWKDREENWRSRIIRI